MPRDSIAKVGQSVCEKYSPEEVRHIVVPAHGCSLLAAQTAAAVTKDFVAADPRGKHLSKTGTPKFLPEVLAFHLDHAAHLVQAGAHTLSDTIPQSF